MHIDGDAAIFFGSEALRLNIWAYGLELARPVITDGCVSVNATAFPSVGPVDIRVHGSEHCIDFAAVEGGVHMTKKLDCTRHIHPSTSLLVAKNTKENRLSPQTAQ